MVYGNPVTSQAMAFCAEKEDGYYANPGVCQSFIKCWNNMGSEFACPDNLIWDDSHETVPISILLAPKIGIFVVY